MTRSQDRPDPALVESVRALLDRIAAAERRANDELEEVVEAAAAERVRRAS
jgi:rubrerythrin